MRAIATAAALPVLAAPPARAAEGRTVKVHVFAGTARAGGVLLRPGRWTRRGEGGVLRPAAREAAG
jgi:hypothetical protein